MAVWVSLLIVVALCLVSAFVVFKKIMMPKVQAILSLIYIVAVIAQIINLRVDPDSAISEFYEDKYGFNEVFSPWLVFWGGVYATFLYPVRAKPRCPRPSRPLGHQRHLHTLCRTALQVAMWLKQDKLATFNQFRIRRAFYPPSVHAARGYVVQVESLLGKLCASLGLLCEPMYSMTGRTLTDQWVEALAPKQGCWARTSHRWAGFLSVMSSKDMNVHDPRLGELDTESLYR